MRKKRVIATRYTALIFAVLLAPCTLSAATSHYERGCELYDMERWIDARNELREARREMNIDESLESQNIDYLLAMCDAELGLHTAGDMLTNFSREYPNTPYQDNILFTRGVLATEEANLDKAFGLLLQVNEERLDADEQEEYNIRVGYMYFHRGEDQQALHYLGRIPRHSKFYDHALYYKSYIAYQNRDYAPAKSGFQELLGSDSYKSIAPYYLLQIEFAAENYDGAIDYGIKLLDATSVDQQGELVRTMAESYFRSEDYDKAVTYIDRYISSGGELGRTESYLKGFSLHQMKRYKEAIDLLKRACGADDAMTQNASFHLANCYLRTGDKAGALKAFSMASNDEFNAQIAEEALFNYAKLQYELGGGVFNESINVLTKYINKYTNSKRIAVAQSLLAAAYYNSRDYATAYEKIGLIKNPDAEIRAAKQKITYLRGLECFTSGDYVAAERYLAESIKIGITAKQVSLANYWIGEIDFRSGDYDGAIKGYNYLLARAPKSDAVTTEAQYSIAYALLMQGNTKSALEYFQNYVTSSQSVTALRADAYNRIGDIYYQMRNFDQATKSYNSAIACGVADSNYPKYQNAIILGVQGDVMGKISALRDIMSGESGTSHLDDAHYELGSTYIKNGNYKDAITTLENFIEKYARSPLYAQSLSDLGVAYINAKDSKSALSYYDKAIKAAPQSQIAKDAMQGIREIYVGQGDAQSYFKYAEQIGMEGDLNAVMRDSLSFASARGLYFASEGSQSKQRGVVTSLNSYIKDYPNGYYLSDALFYLSDCYIKLDDKNSAISTLTTLSDRGQSQYSERVYKILASLTLDERRYSESAKASRNLFDVAKDSATQQQAMMQYAKATILSNDSDAITKMSQEIIALGEAKTGTEAMSEALYIQTTQQRERGEREAALRGYQEIITRESAKAYHSESHYYIIDDTYRKGDHEKAEELIFALSDSAAPDPYWLAKSFILLGDIYVADGDNFQARATYQSIVDGYSNTEDSIIEIAKNKIGELK